MPEIKIVCMSCTTPFVGCTEGRPADFKRVTNYKPKKEVVTK